MNLNTTLFSDKMNPKTSKNAPFTFFSIKFNTLRPWLLKPDAKQWRIFATLLSDKSKLLKNL